MDQDQPRWTLRELLLAVVWLSAGMGLVRFSWATVEARAPLLGPWEWGLVTAAYFAGAAAIGTGLGTIFQRQFIGAVVGICFALWIPCLL